MPREVLRFAQDDHLKALCAQRVGDVAGAKRPGCRASAPLARFCPTWVARWAGEAPALQFAPRRWSYNWLAWLSNDGAIIVGAGGRDSSSDDTGFCSLGIIKNGERKKPTI
jgi:hypothetical protein